jgi:hypothetical protein
MIHQHYPSSPWLRSNGTNSFLETITPKAIEQKNLINDFSFKIVSETTFFIFLVDPKKCHFMMATKFSCPTPK